MRGKESNIEELLVTIILGLFRLFRILHHLHLGGEKPPGGPEPGLSEWQLSMGVNILL